MKIIEQATWPRKKHFDLFSGMDTPHFNLTANIDVTQFRETVKIGGHSFTVATAYLLTLCANTIPEFRQRIRGEMIIEHDTVSPSFTMLGKDDLFSFCTVRYQSEFKLFEQAAFEKIAEVKEQPILADGPAEDDLLYLTSIPWVSFTSIQHPMHYHPVDSVPRLAWGKMTQHGGSWSMPLSVQAHHGLLDGVHAGRYFEKVQMALDNKDILSSVTGKYDADLG